MGNKPHLATNGRLQKAKTTWGILRKIFLNAGIKTFIRIQLRNAIVRSTLTYGLQPQNIESNLNNRKLGGFTYKCIRQIHDNKWYLTPDGISRNTQYAKYRQPTTKSWVRKLETTHLLRQTPKEWKIHTTDHQNIQKIQTLWMETCERHSG